MSALVPTAQSTKSQGRSVFIEKHLWGMMSCLGGTQVTCLPWTLEGPHLSKIHQLCQLWSDRVGKGWQKRRIMWSQSLMRLPLPTPARLDVGTRETKHCPTPSKGSRERWHKSQFLAACFSHSQDSIASSLTKPFLSICIIYSLSHSVLTTTWDTGTPLLPDLHTSKLRFNQTYRTRQGVPHADQAMCTTLQKGPESYAQKSIHQHTST